MPPQAASSALQYQLDQVYLEPSAHRQYADTSRQLAKCRKERDEWRARALAAEARLADIASRASQAVRASAPQSRTTPPATEIPVPANLPSPEVREENTSAEERREQSPSYERNSQLHTPPADSNTDEASSPEATHDIHTIQPDDAAIDEPIPARFANASLLADPSRLFDDNVQPDAQQETHNDSGDLSSLTDLSSDEEEAAPSMAFGSPQRITPAPVAAVPSKRSSSPSEGGRFRKRPRQELECVLIPPPSSELRRAMSNTARLASRTSSRAPDAPVAKRPAHRRVRQRSANATPGPSTWPGRARTALATPDAELRPLAYDLPVTDLVASVPHFDLPTDLARVPHVTRRFLLGLYGCPETSLRGHMHTKPYTQSRLQIKGKRAVTFANTDFNPHLPARPGASGVLLTRRTDVLFQQPTALFVGRAAGEWEYVGDYKSEVAREMSAEEFCTIDESVQRKWAHGITIMKLNECWKAMRQIVFGDDKHRPNDPEAEEIMFQALRTGVVNLQVIAFQCKGYNADIAHDILEWWPKREKLDDLFVQHQKERTREPQQTPRCKKRPAPESTPSRRTPSQRKQKTPPWIGYGPPIDDADDSDYHP
ncbi:hypothetical protein BD626DRAFT_472686 [Schizophyllum amplum]|uniref:DUF6697 domain-containing protein n=1 Tax=Schizophyllum amplum TaxID=97359 RepID=A0A550CW62_9AGAR|nr:hypothetical protein BD626DRAFT_472686 [Auriculariopsis ampla]